MNRFSLTAITLIYGIPTGLYFYKPVKQDEYTLFFLLLQVYTSSSRKTVFYDAINLF